MTEENDGCESGFGLERVANVYKIYSTRSVALKNMVIVMLQMGTIVWAGQGGDHDLAKGNCNICG